MTTSPIPIPATKADRECARQVLIAAGIAEVSFAEMHDAAKVIAVYRSRETSRLRHAVDQLGFNLAGTEHDALSQGCLAVLRGEPINPLFDPSRTY